MKGHWKNEPVLFLAGIDGLSEPQEPTACHSKRLPQHLCLCKDRAPDSTLISHSANIALCTEKVSSAGLISLPFEPIICQSKLGNGMLLVLWSTFSAVKSGIQIKWLMSCQYELQEEDQTEQFLLKKGWRWGKMC